MPYEQYNLNQFNDFITFYIHLNNKNINQTHQ